MLEGLREYAETENEKRIIEAYYEQGSGTAAAKSLGADPGNTRQVIRRVHSRKLNDPDFNDTSTLIRHKHKDDSSTGKILEWVKRKVNYKQQVDAFLQIVDSMIHEIEPLPPIPYEPHPALDDCFSCIPLGDPHIGLLTWSKEVGVDWDLNIADRVYRKVFTRLLAKLPDTKECVLVNTGDFFHADNIQGMTSRSGHILDLDGRHGKWLDAGFIILRMFIDACLRKYETVHFYNVPGNHDDILGRALGSYAEQLYRDNPRCHVYKGDNPFQYFHKDKILLGFAHGHKCKLASLPGKMADDEAQRWGNSTYRHWITGHVHHNSWQQFKENPGCTVETVGIIPPKDAYAHGGAYGAGRGIQGIIFNYAKGKIESRGYEQVEGDD